MDPQSSAQRLPVTGLYTTAFPVIGLSALQHSLHRYGSLLPNRDSKLNILGCVPDMAMCWTHIAASLHHRSKVHELLLAAGVRPEEKRLLLLQAVVKTGSRSSLDSIYPS